MMRLRLGSIAILLLAACSSKKDVKLPVNEQHTAAKDTQASRIADASTILARKEVPVLCYHNIRNFRAGESDRMKSYTVTPSAFAEQMKTLADSGYQTIDPEDLFSYLAYGKQLPPKPIIISFDDTDVEHYSICSKEMSKYGFKGLYFIMTISINRPKYMSAEQLKELSDSGHTIACHTWDHHMVTKYQGATWDSQLVMPKKKLEAITGRPVKHFAYPFGLWNKESIPEIEKRGYQMAFILSGKRDSLNPLFTVRRMIVPGTWSTAGMMKAMRETFRL
jgi:peptidoglycan/xylan/chitin deacetylase (PgdA/CDA1 family)